MSLLNNNFIAFDGTPVTSQVPTQMVVYPEKESGDKIELTPALYSAVCHAYKQFCDMVKFSAFPNGHHVQNRQFSDGSSARFESNNSVQRAMVWPVGGGGLERKFYVDTGWLHDNTPEVGWPASAGNGRFHIQHTFASFNTFASIAKFLNKFFKNTFTDLGQVGKSFGVDTTYINSADPAADMAMDALRLKAKIKALPVLGTLTGLARCWAKGLIGRPLSQTPEVFTFEWGNPFLAGGFVLDYYKTGILIGSRGFTMVKINGTNAEMQPLAYPKELDPVFAKLKRFLAILRGEIPPRVGEFATAEVCILLATYILAYVNIKNLAPGYIAPIGGESVDPLAGGWKFSYFSNKCVAVEGVKSDYYTVTFKTQVLKFSEVLDAGVLKFTAKIDSVDAENYRAKGAPLFWIPAPVIGKSYHLGVLTDDVMSSDEPVFNAYYDRDDKLVKTFGGGSGYSNEAGWATTEDSRGEACREGEAFSYVEQVHGETYTTNLRCLANGSNAYTLNVPQLPVRMITDVRVVAEPAVLEMESFVAFYPLNNPDDPNLCQMIQIGEILDDPQFNLNHRTRGWYSTVTNTTKGSFGGNRGGRAVVPLSHMYGDSSLLIGTSTRSESGTKGISSEYGIMGVRISTPANYEPAHDEADFFYKVVPERKAMATGGGIHSSPTSSSEYEGKIYRSSTAVVVLASDTPSKLVKAESVVSNTTDEVQPQVVLEGFHYGLSTPPLDFIPYCVHSAHKESWVMVHPSLPKYVVSGNESAIFLGNTPIGGQ